jgi:thiosulfate/3-mercaptopyruvate sulfurtransferase
VSPLVTVEDLAARRDRPLLIDVRWTLAGADRAGYLAGHLPGAVFCDLDADLAGPPGDGGRHPLPPPDVLATSLARLGVRASRPVVVYDAGPATAAARAWWCLRWLGHPDVRVLDGGLAAWTASGRPVEAGWVEPVAGDLTARPGGMAVVDAAGAAALARAGVLLDARTPERFRGEHEPVDPVAGHVPGAVNAPGSQAVGQDGRFLEPAELRAWAEGLGADGTRPVGAYCGSGVTAAHLVLALELAGVAAALYPGSWSDWIRDPSRPVATR